eukprot:CAMPEP_0195524678 /NCGR_PEP_ID=MMETSP0794_2-20130614/24651_1 /TAXON_ID=515487 /ORGANISM="Stephanopyxis turris, Strain CCMP 815" /LENGTH=93 /DNA_ID=CAMNT_0040654947 /DNA_START=61 /DNA_END=342 /DNA_ORIENTATION=+
MDEEHSPLTLEAELEQLEAEKISLQSTIEALEKAGNTGTSLEQIVSEIKNREPEDAFVVVSEREEKNRFHSSAPTSKGGGSSSKGDSSCCTIN